MKLRQNDRNYVCAWYIEKRTEYGMYNMISYNIYGVFFSKRLCVINRTEVPNKPRCYGKQSVENI